MYSVSKLNNYNWSIYQFFVFINKYNLKNTHFVSLAHIVIYKKFLQVESLTAFFRMYIHDSLVIGIHPPHLPSCKSKTCHFRVKT